MSNPLESTVSSFLRSHTPSPDAPGDRADARRAVRVALAGEPTQGRRSPRPRRVWDPSRSAGPRVDSSVARAGAQGLPCRALVTVTGARGARCAPRPVGESAGGAGEARNGAAGAGGGWPARRGEGWEEEAGEGRGRRSVYRAGAQSRRPRGSRPPLRWCGRLASPTDRPWSGGRRVWGRGVRGSEGTAGSGGRPLLLVKGRSTRLAALVPPTGPKRRPAGPHTATGPLPAAGAGPRPGDRRARSRGRGRPALGADTTSVHPLGPPAPPHRTDPSAAPPLLRQDPPLGTRVSTRFKHFQRLLLGETRPRMA